MYQVTKTNQVNFFIENNTFFLNYFQLHGLLPFNVSPEKRKSVINKFVKQLYSFLFIIGFIINFYTVTLDESYFLEIGGVTWFADTGIWIGTNLSNLISYLEILWKKKSFQELISSLNDLDFQLLECLKCRIDYKKLRNRKFKKNIIILAIIWSCMLMATWNIFIGKFTQYFIQLVIPSYGTYIISLMLIFLIDSVDDRLHVCTLRLKELNETNTILTHFNKGKFKMTQEKLSNKFGFVEVCFTKDVLNTVSDVFDYLNVCFGWTILFIFMNYFVQIACNSYWIFILVESFDSNTTLFGKLRFKIFTKLY